jgi:predicted Holliday junction resolvase-like endonuclease
MIYLGLFLCAIFLWTLWTFQNQNNKLNKQVTDLSSSLAKKTFELSLKEKSLEAHQKLVTDITKKFEEEVNKNNDILSRKRSSEVRVGAITENLIPIIQGLPYDPTNLKHLGQPLDYVYFDYDGPEGVEIVFIEVKSGKAKESRRQKLLKHAIKLGKVYYEELRVDEGGIKIKRAVNED